MRKCNVKIDDPHFQELHHALGCPWPDEIMGETYRNFFSVGDDSATAARMKASSHWTDGREVFGSKCFHVTDEGRSALLGHIREYIQVPARYVLTFRHHEGQSIVSARNRSAAKYEAYCEADIDWPFVEFVSQIKSVRLHSPANIPAQSSHQQ